MYDYFWLAEERLCIVVADVSDKGMAAALFMARTKTAIRLIASCIPANAMSLREFIARLNDELCRDNPHAMFVALVLCVIDVRTGGVEWCNAGLPPPFIVSANGDIEPRNEAIGCPLGLPVPDGYAIGTTTIAAGTSVFLNTDGITEAANPSGELFGDLRLRQALSAAARRAPEDLLSAVLGEMACFCGTTEPSDDVAALILRFNP